jgi:hypothetical protein
LSDSTLPLMSTNRSNCTKMMIAVSFHNLFFFSFDFVFLYFFLSVRVFTFENVLTLGITYILFLSSSPSFPFTFLLQFLYLFSSRLDVFSSRWPQLYRSFFFIRANTVCGSFYLLFLLLFNFQFLYICSLSTPLLLIGLPLYWANIIYSLFCWFSKHVQYWMPAPRTRWNSEPK